MRIVLVGPAHPYKGGGARHTTELAHRLSAAGHHVTIESWRAQYPTLLYPGTLTVDESEGDPYPDTRRDLAWYHPLGWWRAGRRIGREVDLVVLAVLSPVQVPPYLAILAGIGGRARTVALCHNILPHERRPTDTVLIRALLRRVDTVLTHTPAHARTAHQLARTSRVRVVTRELPPHLPGEPPAPAPEREPSGRLLFFGIVRPYKGVDVLLRAFAAGAPAEAELTVAGEFWQDAQELRDLAAELGIPHRVTFREGYVPAAELPGLFGGADALVLPYRAASATQNVWLAHAHGLPVIATRAGTLPDHVEDGRDGLLCEPGDTHDLARAIAEFYTPGVARSLASEVVPADPRPYWRNYLAAVTGGTGS